MWPTKHADRAPSTVARATVAIRSFFRFLATEKQFETDPGASVEMPNVPRGLPKALTLQQVESLMASPVGDDPASHRDRAILEVLYGCGLRIGELVGLDDVDVDLDGELLRVFGKGRRQGAWMVVRGHGSRVGLGAELTPHVLRHSCATHMLKHGADIRYVQELLGHRSISSTQRYTGFRDEEIRQIYDRSHPRAEVQLQEK